MQKVIFLRDSHVAGVIYVPGQVAGVPEELAKALISSGAARDHDTPKPQETKTKGKKHDGDTSE